MGQFGTDSQIFCVVLALFVLPVCLLIFFQTSEQGFFGAGIFLDQMAWAVTRIKWNCFGFHFCKTAPLSFRPGV